MSQQFSKKQYSLDYGQLIQDYKRDYFKKMPILNHEFVYASFHPSLDDCLIALEKNYYPQESDLYGLVQSPESFYQKIIKNLEGLKNPDKIKKFAEMIGIRNNLLTEISEEDNDLESIKLSPKANRESPKSKHGTPKLKNEEELINKIFKNNTNEQTPSVPSISILANKLKEKVLNQIESDKLQQAFDQENPNQKRFSHFIRSKVAPNQDTLIKRQTMYLTGEILKHQQLASSENHTQDETKQSHHIPTTQGANHENKEKFRFFEPKALIEQKLTSSNKKKYAVSIWKINRGSQSFQLKEYAFNLKPIGNKFYASHNGKQILLYLGNERKDSKGADIGVELETIKILNSETLEFIKEINAKVELNLHNQQILDSALIWNCSYLYIQCFEICYFIDLQKSEITNEYSLLNETVDKNQRMKITTYINKKFQHALFKEDEPMVVYGVVEIHKQRVHENGNLQSENQMFEMIKFNLDSAEIFPGHQYLTISKSKLDYNGSIAYNKQLTHIVFPGEQVFYVYTLPTNLSLMNKISQQVYNGALQPIRNVQNCQTNKHSFLHDHIWITYNDESYDTFTTTTEDFSKKFPLSDFDLDNYQLGDTIKEAKQDDQEQNVISIGRNNSKESSVSSRFCMNSSKFDEPSIITPEHISYVNELSEFICTYPFLIFCKGNSELFIQCLHTPTNLIKMDLQDQFLCFVEINYNMEHKPEHIAFGMKDGSLCFRNYETVAFLTQKEDRIHLNLIEYKLPFGGNEVCRDQLNHNHQIKSVPFLFEEDKEPETNKHKRSPSKKQEEQEALQNQQKMANSQDDQYLFYRSAIAITKPQSNYNHVIYIDIVSYGSIIKAVFSKVKHKECKDHDYILILQYRNTILIRSFYNLYHLNIDKYIFKFPFIYLPSKKKNKSDMTFFVAKDGYSTKIERICFNGKDMKDSPISTVYELKTSNVFIFDYHNGFFYLMDDSLALKKFQYDRRTQKLKLIKLYEFALEYRDLLSSLSNDFNDIQVTERGVYKGVLFIPFYDASIYNKDYSLIKVESVLNIKNAEDLFAGPKKLSGTQYLMYIARENNDSKANEYELDSDSEENEEESRRVTQEQHDSQGDESEASSEFDDLHHVPPRSPLKAEFEKQVNQKSSLRSISSPSHQVSADISNVKKIVQLGRAPTISPTSRKLQLENDKSQKLNPNRFSFSIKEDKQSSHANKKINIQTKSEQNPKDKRSFQGIIRQRTALQSKSMCIEDEPVSNDNANSEQVYAWIVPFLDSNVIHLTHNRKDNSNPQYEIGFSSFLNTHDEIICSINNVFYIFAKNGQFLYDVSIEKDSKQDPLYFLKNQLKLQHVSPNLNYFLFYNAKETKFEVFKLVTQHLKVNKIVQNAFRNRKKARRLSTAQALFQIKQKLENEQQQYRFEYVKDVYEVAVGYNEEDYFHQRTVSNQGLVFQLVMQQRVANQRHESNKGEGPDLNNTGSKTDSPQVIPKLKNKFTLKSSMKKTKIEKDFVEKKQLFKEFDQFEEKVINVFQFYIDDDQVQGLSTKFTLIQQHLASSNKQLNEYLNFGYTVLGQYLFIRRGNHLEYMEAFDLEHIATFMEENIDKKPNSYNGDSTYQNVIKKKTEQQKATLLNLKFDKGVEVMRVMETVRDDLIQIIACDNRFMYVITWDILHNNEYAMIQIENQFNFQAAHIVCKGMSEKLNYIPLNQGLYDLNYSLPFMIFENIKVSSNKTTSMQMNERKLSRFNKEYLDIFDNNKVYLSYTYLDLCYMKALKSMNEDAIDLPQIMVQHLGFRVNGTTVFHEFALNHHLLQHLYEEICKIDEQAMIGSMQSDREQDMMKAKKLIFLNLLYPNFYNNTAFDVAMVKKSPKSIEIMLGMLTQLPLFSISKWIMPHFQELLAMELKSFNDFMETCQFQQPKMREVRMIKWPYKEDDHFMDFHTSYLGSYFHNMLQKLDPTDITQEDQEDGTDHESQHQQILKTEDFTMFELVDGVGNTSNLRGKNLRIYEKNKKKKKNKKNKKEDDEQDQKADIGKSISFDQLNGPQMKRVELNAVEFDWVFRGQMAIDFIAHLAQTDNDQLFRNQTIRIIVLFLWEKFFYNIRNKIFFPFIIYFLCYIVLTTVIYEKKVLMEDYLLGLNTNDTTGFSADKLVIYNQANMAFVIICFIGWFYFLMIEIFQIQFFRLEYFKQFWNYIDMSSLLVNLAFFVANIMSMDHQSGRILATISVFLIYIKAFYFFRLFSPTAAFMRMIIQICLDIRVFVLIWFFAIIAFSNATYILSQNLDYDTMYGLIQNSIFQTFIYNYGIELGSFQTTTYNTGTDQQLWWIIFLLQTILIQIIFLNLLIAIMSDTFERVQASRVESKLREICQLISEYEYVVNRENVFKNSKYIIVASVEKAMTNDSDDWNGKINTLRNVFQTQMQDLKRDNKQIIENLREELICNSKNVDQKFMDLQSFVMKQNSQSTLMLKKIDTLSDKITHQYKQSNLMHNQAEGKHQYADSEMLEKHKQIDETFLGQLMKDKDNKLIR